MANLGNDGVVYVGKPNSMHFIVAEKHMAQAGGFADTGFVTPQGEYLDRDQALAWVEANEKSVKPSETMARGLDALDYREQVPESARSAGEDRIDVAAKEAATSPANDLPQPTEAQKDAGNYRKGHVRLNGLDISIENPAGSRRRPEWPPLQNHYGYFKGSVGADKDHVDVFMTDRASDPDLPVFVVDQVNPDGSFDEHKVVLGAADEADARATYLGNYEKGWTGLGAITPMTQDEFKAWVRDPTLTKKPAAKIDSVITVHASEEFPQQEAAASYSGISHQGTTRANSDRAAFETFLTGQRDDGMSVAKTDAQKAAVEAELQQLRDEYLQQYRMLMGVRAGTYSGFVAGRSGLNSKQAGNRNSALDRAMERFASWQSGATGRARKAALAARTPAEVQAAQEAAATARQEKDAARLAKDLALVGRVLDWKKGDRSEFAKGTTLVGVNKDRAGYPNSVLLEPTDGAPLVDNKFDLAGLLRRKGESVPESRQRVRELVDQVRAEQGKNGGETAKAMSKRPRGILAKKAAAEEAARADYFTPGNILKSYGGGFDRVVSYTPINADGAWSVNVREVEKTESGWDDVPGARERTHATPPAASELKAGPVDRIAATEAEAAQVEAGDSGQASVAEPTSSKTPTVDSHVDLMSRVRSGEASADEYQRSFARTDASRQAMTAELNTLKKDNLLRSGGYNFAQRYRNDKKDVIVQALVNRILDEYSLGRRYGSSSYVMSTSGLAAHREAQDAALRELVANTTDEDLQQYAQEVAAARAEAAGRKEAHAQTLANPKTLADFRAVMRHHIAEGESREEAFLRLTPEQRANFDALEAESTRETREQAKAKLRTKVAAAGQLTTGEVVETKHTKHGHDLFVVQLAERVSREDYDTLNISAKRMGGSYSSYRGNGAVPGFQFRTREAADAFGKLVTGDSADAQAVAEARRDAFDDDRSQSAVERLRTMAHALHERADESLGRERKANTDRRARMAASADASARADKALAGTMENLAEAIEDGKAKFLDAVRQKLQVEFLAGELRSAKDAQIRAKYRTYGEQERHRGEPVDAETVDFSTFPTYTAMRSDLASLGRQMLEVDGAKKLGARLMSVADDVSEAYTDWAKQNLRDVSHFGMDGGMAEFGSREDAERAIRRSGIADRAIVLPIKRGQNRVVLSPSEAMKRGLWNGDGDKRITLSSEFGAELVEAVGRRAGGAIRMPWVLEAAHAKRKRLHGMGIFTGSEYRAALREFAGIQEAIATPNKIKEMERAMVGRRADGLDFFPTSAEVVDSMLSAADIQPGMAVLEPSAGMGHIADAIREHAGVEPDVVEMSGERRELLEAKGYTLVGSDFTAMKPRAGFTFGDVFRDTDGTLGVMRGSRGMASDRVGFQPLDENGQPDARIARWVSRDELVGVEQRDSDSGYDRIVMNPPFSKGRDIQHVRHAFDLLRPGGRLVAIMGEGAFFHSNKQAESFREWLETLGATSEKLPEGSFMDPSLPVNTGVSARMVVIDKPDNLQEPQTEDAAFRRWFGDSKAVDSQGRPLVLYHGTDADITTFQQSENGESGAGIYATDDPDRASVYAGDGYRRGGNVMPIYMSIRNPATTADVEAARSTPAIKKLTDVAERGAAVQQALMAQGFDGVIGENPTEYVAFRPEQVKSAIGNDGNFDPTKADIRFRRAEAEGQGLTDGQMADLLRIMRPAPAAFSDAARAQAVGQVRATVDAIRKGWSNGPEVVVAFDMNDPAVPEAARRADLRQRSGGASGAPEGFYWRGKAYLLASKLNTPADAARVLHHEVLGHHGLRGIFGPELNKILNQVATMRQAEVAAKIKEYGLPGVTDLSRRHAAEEVLAEMAEKTPQLHFVRRAVAAIRNWLRANVPGFAGLKLTDADIIQAYILPARGFVERGQRAATDRIEPVFSRSDAPATTPDAIIGSTLGSASKHPDYAAAKAGDIEAAVRVAQSLVSPELVAQVKAAIGNTRPRVVPVVAEEAAGRNKIPLTAAEVLAGQLGLDVETGIVQANRAHRTGLDGLDRIFAPVDFAGAVVPGPYLLVDDTLTQGGTFAALASHIRDGGGTVAGVVALTGKQYSAKIQPSPETLTSLRQKHGDLEDQFRAATGYGFDALTESEARYLARYEPADRLRDRISAEGRRAGQRADQGDPGQADADDALSFSRSRLSAVKDSALDQITQTFSHPGKVSLWDKTVGTMRNLGERVPQFKPVFEAAQRFIDDVSMLANDAADFAPRLMPRVETLADLKKKPITAADNKAVAKPLFEGTLLWARDIDGQPLTTEALNAKYAKATADEKAQILLRTGKIQDQMLRMWRGQPLDRFETIINNKFESTILKPGIVWSDSELKSIFGLSADQVSLYREARAAIDRSIDMTARTDMLRMLGEDYAPMRNAVLDQQNLQDAFDLVVETLQADARANPGMADRLLGINNSVVQRFEMANELTSHGYAPLSRFGKYTVDVVDQAGERQYFGMFESKREANQMALKMRDVFKGAAVTQGTMSEQAFKLFQGITPESLEQFGSMLGLKSDGNEAKDKAFQAYLQLAKNNHSALKRLIHRKGIDGYSEDVGRVLASFVYSNARLGSGGLNAGTMESAVEAIPKEMGELRDVAMGLRSYIQDPQEEGQAVRGLLFAQYLGGSVASAMVNMTQPFQITMPWLSQYGGMRKAASQMARALKDMGTKGFRYEPDLAKALQDAVDDGTVSPQEIHQLMAQARGTGSLRTGDGTRLGDARATAANNWERVKVAWGQPFALAEQFNRRSTFIAAYRTAKEQGMAKPAEFARQAVLETQFLYSKANKMRWARGAVGGSLMTFKTYSVSYLELMHRMWTQGGPEGKRAVGWSVAMLLLMAGAGGLPFMEDAEDLIDGAGQMMGYNVSAKQWRKEFLQSVVGRELAGFMEQGMSGLPGAPIDISGRLGLGNLIPGTGLFLTKQNRERDLLEIAGPAGDLVARGFTGARKALTGDVGGAAMEISPTAVRNLVKGADMAATGMYRDTKGYKVLDTTLAEAAAKTLGFQPKSVSEVQEANSFMLRSKSFYTQTSSEIKVQWAQALFEQDEAALERVRDRVAAWNRDNPEQPIVVKIPDVMKRVREMGKPRTDRIADTAPKALRQQMREIAQEAGR